VLIIGGGDGGALEEALKHPLDRAILVEIDEAVVRTSREYLPAVARGAFVDPRATVVIGDGIAYAGEAAERFDVVLVDSTDPQGPATGLFSPEFYDTIARRLTPGGIMTVQSGSAVYQRDLIRSVRRTLRPFFPIVRTYVAAVVEYPATLWSFTMASLGPDPLAVAPESIARRTDDFGLRYYTPAGHHAAFVPPPFLRETTDSSE
jgi:spermidine synthase